MSTDLHLYLPGPINDAERVVSTLSNLVALLGVLERGQRPSRTYRAETSTWQFSELRLGSLNAALRPSRPVEGSSTSEMTRVALVLVQGFQQLEQEEALPNGWDGTAATKARSITRDLSEDVTAGIHLRLVEDGRDLGECQVTRRSGRNLLQATRGVYQSIGSVTGTLGSISIHSRKQAGLWLDRGPRVAVYFSEAQQARIAPSLGERVTVAGRLKRNRQGQVLSVNMRRIERLGPPRDIEGLIGLDPGIAGGLSAVEHIRAVRG